MNLFSEFEAGLPLARFLAKYGTDAHRTRWQMALDQTALTAEQRALVGTFTRRTNVLVLAGAWCGDCSSQCPIFERIAEAAPALVAPHAGASTPERDEGERAMIVTRYLDRDEHADVQALLQINGGNRVPVAVFFSEDGHEVARYGERTLARYRQLVSQLTGEGCATGFVKGDDPTQRAVVQEWLNEFERVQWVLRLSPRLRRVHND
jgi:thiol-disulfide isomerase/thioredoxin